jgi:hypothetical protein
MKIHDFDPHHQDLISQIAEITHIERGTLTEEYRERPNPEGGLPLKTGPYYKHQCWEDKRNRSCRITSEEVPLLQEHLQSGQHFDELVAELAALVTANSRQQRAKALTPVCDVVEASKKNSRKKPSVSATAKPKPSSQESPNVLPKKGPKA